MLSRTWLTGYSGEREVGVKKDVYGTTGHGSMAECSTRQYLCQENSWSNEIRQFPVVRGNKSLWGKLSTPKHESKPPSYKWVQSTFWKMMFHHHLPWGSTFWQQAPLPPWWKINKWKPELNRVWRPAGGAPLPCEDSRALQEEGIFLLSWRGLSQQKVLGSMLATVLPTSISPFIKVFSPCQLDDLHMDTDPELQFSTDPE